MGAHPTPRIVIIDDNPAIHRDFAKILAPPRTAADELDDLKAALFGDAAAAPPGAAREPMRFQLESATQGREGLALVERALAAGQPFAMAFVDMQMPPGWDGLETIEHIWAVAPDLQVVICTAYSDYAWGDIAGRLGGHVENLLILKKPFDPIEVVQLAHALTRKWQLHRAEERAREGLEEAVRQRTAELAEAKARLEQEMRDRERMETELRLAQKLEAVGQLAAGIAHEINTPMQYVGDSVHFLQRAVAPVVTAATFVEEVVAALGEDPAHAALAARAAELLEAANLAYVHRRVPRAFERTLEGVERVTAIVRAMKEFAHPDQKDQSAADLSHALENALLVARNEYKYVADVETELALLPPVMCQPGEVNQVFLNLLINAAHAIEAVVKGSDRRGKITVRTGVEGGWVWIEIADTGCGIPQAIATRVFDPFFTTKPVGKGTGQGLAIARSIIVDKHGGRLTFESEVGRGTTFRIELPIAGRGHAGDGASTEDAA
jgi:signal transduction histidine kinase